MRYPKAVSLCVKELDERKAENIEVIDVKENTPFADYYVIATCPNEKAIGAFAGDIQETLEKDKHEVRNIEGTPESGWMIVDAGDVVIHLFLAAKREEIDLDKILEKSRKK